MPKVSDSDVERIVRRDFAAADVSTILALLQEYGTKTWHNEPARVRLGILRIADGNLDQLRKALAVANQDYRDILASAEYPRHLRLYNVPDRENPKRNEAIEADWQQFREWFERK